jgi:hypothetical protein
MELRPLNIFQRVMRVWEEAHPYNALQILEVSGAGDVGKMAEAWNAVLESSGLGNAVVKGRWFSYEKAERQEVMVVDGGEGTKALRHKGTEGEAKSREGIASMRAGLGLDGFITREMNRPFSPMGPKASRRGGTSMPFRAFVLQGEGTHHMGLVYQHWVADSISIRMLLKEWFCRLHDPGQVSGKPLEVPFGGFWRYFGPKRAGWSFFRGLMMTAKATTQFSGARKIERDTGEQRVECSVHRLPEGMVDGLLAAARKRKMTLNDLFMAALAQACDKHGAAPRGSERDLALGSIVDLRAMSSEKMDDIFGMFLGFTAVVVKANLLKEPEKLLESIAAQHAAQKESKAPQISMLRLAAGYMQGRVLSPERLASFYRNYLPMSGGVSNVNMNRSWPATYHPMPLVNYVRVAPTGPMVPVVIAVTTIGKQFSFVLTRRASLVDAELGKGLAQTFIDELTARAELG